MNEPQVAVAGGERKADPEGPLERTLVARTLKTLELLAQSPRSESALARDLGTHRRTVQRLLGRLVDQGYVMRRGADYALTLKVVALSGAVLDAIELVPASIPFVERLRDLTGQASHLDVPGEDAVVHVVGKTAKAGLTVKPRLGQLEAYHSTAVGKALLAYLPEKCERVLRSGLPAYTDHTIVNPGDLLLELAAVRERGYAIDDLENTLDVRCVAAPVFDHMGVAVAALGISAPAASYSPQGLLAVGLVVSETARDLSSVLGYVARPSSRSRSTSTPKEASSNSS